MLNGVNLCSLAVVFVKYTLVSTLLKLERLDTVHPSLGSFDLGFIF